MTCPASRIRAQRLCLGRARGDLNPLPGIDLSITVKKCTQEWLRQVEIGP
jgi:hypothetical protein